MKIYWYDFLKEDRYGYYEETDDKVDELEKCGIGNYYLNFRDGCLGMLDINMSPIDKGFNGYYCSWKRLGKCEIEKLGKMVWKR